MLLTLGLLTVTVAVLATVDMEWYVKLVIVAVVQAGRVAWLVRAAVIHNV